MVALVTRGFAQKPMLKIYPNVIIKNNIAKRNPINSAKPPMMSGTTAPPAMPEHKIPENVPWW